MSDKVCQWENCLRSDVKVFDQSIILPDYGYYCPLHYDLAAERHAAFYRPTPRAGAELQKAWFEFRATNSGDAAFNRLGDAIVAAIAALTRVPQAEGGVERVIAVIERVCVDALDKHWLVEDWRERLRSKIAHPIPSESENGTLINRLLSVADCHPEEPFGNLLRSAAAALAAPPAPASAEVERALRQIHDTFAADLKQGYRTRDKEFAVEVAAFALKHAAPPTPASAEVEAAVYDARLVDGLRGHAHVAVGQAKGYMLDAADLIDRMAALLRAAPPPAAPAVAEEKP